MSRAARDRRYHDKLRERTRILRQELYQKLGGKCVRCGDTENLSFEHIVPRNYHINRLHSAQRLRVVQKEIDRGEVTVACVSCNSYFRNHPEYQKAFHQACTEGGGCPI